MHRQVDGNELRIDRLRRFRRQQIILLTQHTRDFSKLSKPQPFDPLTHQGRRERTVGQLFLHHGVDGEVKKNLPVLDQGLLARIAGKPIGFGPHHQIELVRQFGVRSDPELRRRGVTQQRTARG